MIAGSGPEGEELASPGARCMRDPTRGGLASALNEIAAASDVGVQLDEAAIPVRAEVRGACPGLGFRHAASDTLLLYRDHRPEDTVAPRDVFMTRFFLDQRGLMNPEAFESHFRKTPA